MVNIGIVNSSSFGKLFLEHISQLEEFSKVSRHQIDSGSDLSIFTEELSDLDGIIASVTPVFSKEVLKALPKLKIITRHGVGCDNVDLVTCTELGIPVSKVSWQVEQASVAELAVALLMSVARRVVEGDRLVRDSLWASRATLMGLELKGKTVGLIGVGAIGSYTGQILKNGFGMNVLGYDPARTKEQLEVRGVEKVSLEELLKVSDVISLHCPLNNETLRILNKDRLTTTKKGVIIINTTRGECLDETSLIELLESGHIGGYGTDVVEGEPIDGNHRILKAPRTVVLPHLGGYSYESLKGMGDTMVSDMRKFFVEKKLPGTLANPDVRVRAWH